MEDLDRRCDGEDRWTLEVVAYKKSIIYRRVRILLQPGVLA